MKRLLSILALATLLCPGICFGSPASPDLHELRQPDGVVFLARQWGDERLHGWETEDGYTIVFDTRLGAWTYAQPGEEGDLASSGRLVGKDLPDETSKGLRPTGKALEKALSSKERPPGARGPMKAVPSVGMGKIPLILINFNNTRSTKSAADFAGLFFGTGNHSVADYYEEVSYGKFHISGEVKGWYLASHNHDYYGANIDGVKGNDAHPAQLVLEAAEAADAAGFNFAEYVSGSDCQVDVLVVVHQGTGEESSGVASDIWSHKASLVEKGLSQYVTKSVCLSDPSQHVIVNNYLLIPEIRPNGSLTTIGVPAHEYGHALGLPDLYDPTAKSKGVGQWSLMGGGSFLKIVEPGDRPAHPDAWSKYFLKWVNPPPVKETSCYSIDWVEKDPQVYMLRAGTPLSGEYFLVENRQQIEFDVGLPGSGLLIWHIDGDKINATIATNTVEISPCVPTGAPCPGHYGVALVQADNNWGLENNTDSGDSRDPFFSPDATELTADSAPNSHLWNGSDSNVNILDISGSGYKMSATMSVLPSAINVQVPKAGDKAAKGTTVAVSWQWDGNPGNVVSVKLFKGGAFLRLLDSTSIGDCGKGKWLWTVSADLEVANDYTIEVSDYPDSKYKGVSGQFSITQDLTVTQPASGWVCAAGGTYILAWDYIGDPGPKVKIDLYKGGVFVKTIAYASSGSIGTGYYDWTVPDGLKPGPDYQIKVTSTKYSSYTDTSACFTIPQPLTITSPAGGEAWPQGSQQTISWQYAGNPGPYVNIYLYKGGALKATLASNVSSGGYDKGSFTWTVPDNLDIGAGYQIQVKSTTKASYYIDMSKPFSIVKPAVTWTKVLAANSCLSAVEQTSDGGYVALVAGDSVSTNYVFKLDASGNVLWQTRVDNLYIWYGGYYVRSVLAQTSDGGFIMAGMYSISPSVAKLDAAGNIQWQKVYSEVGPILFDGPSVRQASDGGFIVVGYNEMNQPNACDPFDCSASCYNYFDANWVFKLDSSGTLIWQKTFEKNLQQGVCSMYLDDSGEYSVRNTPDGGYIVSGLTWDVQGVGRCAAYKLNAEGNLQLERTFGQSCSLGGYCYDVFPTIDGGYITSEDYCSGSWYVSYVYKLDAGLNVHWQWLYPSESEGGVAAPTSDGGCIVAEGPNSNNPSWQPALVKLDAKGNAQWQKNLPSTIMIRSIRQTKDGGYIAAVYGPGWIIYKLDANGNLPKSQ